MNRPASGRIAVIPARGGSKRVPGKNIRPLCGRPILAYTIDAALSSRLFERVIVSTDDRRIAELALEYGAEVPFLRDASLADDHTPVSMATLDALTRVDPEPGRFDSIAQLMPNCPLRTAGDILASYAQFEATGCNSQISVVKFMSQTPWWAVTRDEYFALKPIFASHILARSQDLPELFCPTGAVWWARTAALRQAKTFHTPDRTGWQIPWERAIDIDTPEDWKLAELLMASERKAAAFA